MTKSGSAASHSQSLSTTPILWFLRNSQERFFASGAGPFIIDGRCAPCKMPKSKEMLPVVDKPLIQYAVEEAFSAGIREIIFVAGRSKQRSRIIDCGTKVGFQMANLSYSFDREELASELMPFVQSILNASGKKN